MFVMVLSGGIVEVASDTHFAELVLVSLSLFLIARLQLCCTYILGPEHSTTWGFMGTYKEGYK